MSNVKKFVGNFCFIRNKLNFLDVAEGAVLQTWDINNLALRQI